MEHLKGRTLAVLDVETTGTHAQSDRVIEIGILRIEDGKHVDSLRTFVNPEREVPLGITALTGISSSMLDSAPTFAEIVQEIRRLLQGAVIVAHNVNFDYSFLRNEFLRLEYAFEYPCLCTVRLSRLMYPREKSHNLSALIDRHGILCASRHRAYDDAYALVQFLEVVSEARGHEFRTALESLIRDDMTAVRSAVRYPEYQAGEVVIR